MKTIYTGVKQIHPNSKSRRNRLFKYSFSFLLVCQTTIRAQIV